MKAMDIYNKRAEGPRDHTDFESKFEARIEDSREYRQYSRRMPYYMWDGKLPLNTEVEVVPMKAIHLSSDNLERLIRDQERLNQLLDDQLYDKQVIAKLRKDEQVRNTNPAVEKAYQKYVMLLELARQ
jgi:hypothetical protein